MGSGGLKLGAYQQDYYLYFTSYPNNIRYANDIFNKLHQYDGYDIIQLLEFHYNAYPEQANFLRFLKDEIGQRLKRKLSKVFETKLESVLDWLSESKKSSNHFNSYP